MVSRSACTHSTRTNGVCDTCGHCIHDVILNGACFYCSATDIDPYAVSPKKVPQVIPPEQLIRRK